MVTLTAEPLDGYIFGGWRNEAGTLISLEREITVTLTGVYLKLSCKFVDETVQVPGLRRTFKLYKSTGNTHTRQNDDIYIQDVDIYWPLVYKSFSDNVAATWGEDGICSGYGISAGEIDAFNGYVNTSANLTMLTKNGNTENFVNYIPYDFGEPASNGFCYRLVDEDSGYYITLSVADVSTYAQGYFYDDNDTLISGGVRAVYNRDWYKSPVIYLSFGMQGFHDGEPDEESKIVPIAFRGTGVIKTLRINCDQDTGDVVGNDNLLTWFLGLKNVEPVDEYDPTDPSANSGTGGGNGDFEFVFDFTPIEELPERISALGSGFVNLYQIPDSETMTKFAQFMTLPDFIQRVNQFFSKPSDSILAIRILPCELSGSEVSREVIIAGGVSFVDSDHNSIEADRVINQYYIQDLGSISVPKVWGSQLDYQPYTKAEIYLPYIGYEDLDIDEICGKTMGLRYSIDLLSGTCVAFIAINGDLKYQFTGNCASSIPYNENSHNIMTELAAFFGGIGTAVVGAVSGNVPAIAAGGMGAVGSIVSFLKPNIKHGSSVSSTAGFLSLQKPVLYLQRPSQNLAANYKHFNGYPSNITARIGTLSGYTVVDKIHLENIDASEEEKIEIERLLKEGVVL